MHSSVLGCTRGICLAIALAAALAACQGVGTQAGTQAGSQSGTQAAAQASLAQGYTCCNLHYEGDWISDANWGEQPFIPAGTPAKVTGYGRHRASVEIGGKPMRLGHDYGREQEKLDKFAAKIIVAADPKPKIEAAPAAVKEAIRQGKVAIGMTKEQALISVGHPITNETRSLDEPAWNHWLSSFAQYQLMWDANGRLKEVVADPITLRKVLSQAGK